LKANGLKMVKPFEMRGVSWSVSDQRWHAYIGGYIPTNEKALSLVHTKHLLTALVMRMRAEQERYGDAFVMYGHRGEDLSEKILPIFEEARKRGVEEQDALFEQALERIMSR
jgi:hypothetical protein